MQHPFFLRRHDCPTRVPVAIVQVPEYEDLVEPIDMTTRGIDPEILENLCALFQGLKKKEIMMNLLSTE